MVLAPEHPLVDRLTTRRTTRRGRELSRASRGEIRSRTHRSREGKDRRLHRRVRDQSGERRDDSDLDRRLRADGLRHRRDHGRARRTTSAIWNSRASSICRFVAGRASRPAKNAGRIDRLRSDDGIAINSPLIDGLTTPEAKTKIIAWLEENGHGRARCALQIARLAFLAAALLGRAVPDCLAKMENTTR